MNKKRKMIRVREEKEIGRERQRERRELRKKKEEEIIERIRKK